MSIYAAFFLGLAGSLHCAAMCGPLVLALGGARQRDGQGRGWPWLYHGGRILMYMLLGAISGAAGFVLLSTGMERWLSIVAGGLVLVVAVSMLRKNDVAIGGRFTVWLKGRFSRLLQERSSGATVALGALNGLLPCGLVYLAVAAAATAGSVNGGVATMAAFGAGTAPMMLGINFAGRKLAWGGPARWRKTVLVFAVLAGGMLILRGMSLGIPYLSPKIADGQTKSCCQSATHSAVQVQ